MRVSIRFLRLWGRATGGGDDLPRSSRTEPCMKDRMGSLWPVDEDSCRRESEFGGRALRFGRLMGVGCASSVGWVWVLSDEALLRHGEKP